MYGIIQDARKGVGLGVEVLALVDRSRSRRFWWTSDNANIAICYEKKSAADFAAGRLKRNGARVVRFFEVQRLLSEQVNRMNSIEANAAHEAIIAEGEGPGWDAHKDAL